MRTVARIVEQYGALQHPVEALYLLNHLAKNPPGIILELGVWRGGNTALFGTFFPDARLIGVDLLGPDDPDEAFVANCHDIGTHPQLREVVMQFGPELVRGDSGDPLVVDCVRDMLDGRRADLLFIDAAHDYDSVRRDYELWSPLARQVGFHDVHNPDVYRFWQEVSAYPRTFALWKEPDGHGIGVVM